MYLATPPNYSIPRRRLPRNQPILLVERRPAPIYSPPAPESCRAGHEEVKVRLGQEGKPSRLEAD